MQKSLFPILILLLWLLIPGLSSAAGKQTVVLMPLQVSDVDKSMISSMETALVEGLSEKYKVFSGEKVRAKAKEIFNKESKAAVHKDCDETRCMQDIAVAFQAELIAVAAVTKRSDGFFIALNIKNIFDDTVVFSKSIPCKGCDEYQVIDQLRIMAEGNTATAGFIASSASPSAPVGKSGIEEIRPTAETSQSSGPAGLYITTEPKGAEVYLGEIMAGNTDPAFQKLNMEPGQTVRITLKKAEYRDTVFEARLKPGITKYEGIKLKPAFGYLTINGNPDGAVVEIGGSQVGELPLKKLKLKSGKHLLTVRKELYETVSDRIIEVKDGQETTETVTLNEAFGTLNVSSNPTGAEVQIDGKGIGNTPIQEYRISPGKYELTVTKIGYTEKKYTATVIKGKELTITSDKATLREKLFSAQIFSDPPEQGARVYIDGVDKGEAPLTVDNLTEGTHKIEVKTKQKSGLIDVAGKDGESKVVEVKLLQQEPIRAKTSMAINNSDLERARKIFSEICATCHGQNREGKKHLGPPLNRNSFIIDGTEEDIAKVIKNGRSGATKRYKEFASPMPAQKALFDSEIMALAKYLKGDESNADVKEVKPTIKLTNSSYTDNGNGTVTAGKTGLMWQKKDDNKTRKWSDAISYCDGLTLAGYSDWSLPSIQELRTITIENDFTTIDVTFRNKSSYSDADYWSSTKDNNSSGRYLRQSLGRSYYPGGYVSGHISDSGYVRCVRGGQ